VALYSNGDITDTNMMLSNVTAGSNSADGGAWLCVVPCMYRVLAAW
jgi:hypothetical protein